MPIQWYPGHIAKMERELGALLKLIDVVIEVLDARIPLASANPRLRKQYGSRPVLSVLNKADLAEPEQNRRWLIRYSGKNQDEATLYQATGGKFQKKIIDAIVRLGEPKMQALEAKGIKRRSLRVAVVGMPNVGKSTLINSLVGIRKVKTGHKAGVTRQPQWVRIHEKIELLDTPGLIPPRLDSEEAGALLATVSSIGEAAFDDEEIAVFLMQRIELLYPACLRQYYDIPAGTPMDFEQVARQRHYVLRGGAPDAARAVHALLTDFRQGRLGRITLEHAAQNATE